MRERIYNLIEGDDRNAKRYAAFMTVVIALSLLPLCFKEQGPVLLGVECACTVIFILDYIARWMTADLKLGRGKTSFAIYPITPMALFDLISILPSFLMINPALRTVRVIRLLRVLRVFRFLRYSKNIDFVIAVFKRQWAVLVSVLALALGYVLICALVMFNVEPEMFDSFLDAVYWSVVSITTIGYGDITPVTQLGRIITVISALVGVAVVALPTSIITAGFMDELHERRQKREQEEKAEKD